MLKESSLFKKILLFVGLSLVLENSAQAATNENSFTPTLLKKPIKEISLGSSTDSTAYASLYSCSGTLADCMVNIADNTALASLLSASVSISAGTYDQIKISSCTTEGGYTAQVQGQVTLGSTTYYTASGADPLTTSVGSLGPVTLSYSGCVSTYKLPTPVVVTAGSTVHVSLYINLVNITWAKLGTKTIPSGCTENTGKTMSVCSAYPDVVPYVGTTTPTVEIYHLKANGGGAGTEGGQILLLFDASDNILGGFSRRLFSQNSVALSQFDTPLKTFTKNGDGITYTIENYGSSTTTYYWRTTDFQRTTGTTSNITFTLGSGGTVSYDSTKQ
ncbi:MAG: hypothetical protein OEY52_02220 [Gammaproteobacteria bacterium]|nr:hypothetical protein [Gammaproteobacteria bacterium]